MDFQLRISEEALADLQEIFGYSWEYFPEFTEELGQALLSHMEMLRRFPYAGRRLAARPGVRQLVHAPFIIDYLVEEENRAVHIVRVWHGARHKA